MTQILKITRIFSDFIHKFLKICDLNLFSSNLIIRKILIVLLFGVFWINTKAQTSKSFEFVKVDSLFSSPMNVFSKLHPEIKFGGISGIEHHENALYMVSDRAFKNDTNQNSYVFKMDTVGKISGVFRFFGVNNAESIRFDEFTQKMFYAFEGEDSTGVGFINDEGKPTTLFAFPMRTDGLTADNRGIESLCFTQNNKLWFAFESSVDSTVSLFQLPYDYEKKTYDFSRKSVFQYPFDARVCLKPEQTLTGNVGNGITEILPYDTDKLLVMERCFDDRFITMRLFVATVPVVGSLFTKKQLFEFTINNEFLAQNQRLRPDNMEGMCWGQNEEGHRILYVISDDNFSPKRQRTLLLKLKEISYKSEK
jgi:hypothetical protein